MSIISQYSGQYINYESIHDQKQIWEFINQCKVYSNFHDYETMSKQLIEYEKGRKLQGNKKKVFAVHLMIMLPLNITKNEKHQIVNEFMMNISFLYKRILYLYAFEKIGKGDYVHIIAFQRQIYKEKKRIPKVYKRDMFVDKVNGRTCSQDNLNAVHVCKKGCPIKDKNGNVVYEEVYLSPKKYRFLNFKDDSDIVKKKNKFNSFRDRLNSKLIKAITKIVEKTIYLKLCHKRFRKNGNSISKRILLYNSYISRINIKLQNVQKIFGFRGVVDSRPSAWKRFERVFYSLVQIIKNGFISLHNHHINIDPSKRISNDNFKNNLEVLEKIATAKINKWYKEEFNYPIFWN